MFTHIVKFYHMFFWFHMLKHDFMCAELITRHSKNIDKLNNLQRNVSDYKEVLNSQIMHNFVILLLLQTREIKTVNRKYSVLIAKKLKILYTCLINAKLQIT